MRLVQRLAAGVAARHLQRDGYALRRRAIRDRAMVDAVRSESLRWAGRTVTCAPVGRPLAILDDLVESLLPGQMVRGIRTINSRPGAPSRPARTLGLGAARELQRVLIACDVHPDDGPRPFVLGRGRPTPPPFATSPVAGDSVFDVPMSPGDILVTGGDVAVGGRRNLTEQSCVMVEMLVGPATAEVEAAAEAGPPIGADGYRCVDLLDGAQVHAVRSIIDRLSLPEDHPFFTSPKDANGALARELDLAIRSVVGDRAMSLLPGYRPFMVAVTSKGRNGGSVDFHQDWTYVDEREGPAVFLWCPLVDSGRANGGLAVVPGSHRWSDRIRPSRVFPEPVVTEAHQPAYRSMSTTVEVPAGAAAMFDPALIHGSTPNPTDGQRPAITIALAPEDRQLVHFHEDPGGVLTGHEVDEAFFTTAPFRDRPEGRLRLNPWAPASSVADLDRAIRCHGSPDAMATLDPSSKAGADP